MKSKYILPTASLILLIIYLAFQNMSNQSALYIIKDYFLITSFILVCIAIYNLLEKLGERFSLIGRE